MLHLQTPPTRADLQMPPTTQIFLDLLLTQQKPLFRLLRRRRVIHHALLFHRNSSQNYGHRMGSRPASLHRALRYHEGPHIVSPRCLSLEWSSRRLLPRLVLRSSLSLLEPDGNRNQPSRLAPSRYSLQLPMASTPGCKPPRLQIHSPAQGRRNISTAVRSILPGSTYSQSRLASVRHSMAC